MVRKRMSQQFFYKEKDFVLVRVNFTDEEHAALKAYIAKQNETAEKNNKETALTTYHRALDWFLKLNPEQNHRFFFSSPLSAKTRSIWMDPDFYEQATELAKSCDHKIQRIIYTATVRFLVKQKFL